MSSLGSGAVRGLAAAVIGLGLGCSSTLAAESGRSPQESADVAAVPSVSMDNEHRASWTHDGDTFAARLALSGALNRAFFGWNDGGGRDVYFTDPAQDGSFAAAEGEIAFGGGWTLGATGSADLFLAPSDELDQHHRWGRDNRVMLSELYAALGQDSLGKLVLGKTSTATDGIDSINLSESGVVADADVAAWNRDFLIRPAGQPLGRLRWGDFIDGALAGDTRLIAGYTTPEVLGFEASVAAGKKYWDGALRWKSDLGGVLEVGSGIGYWNDRLGHSEPVNDVGWGASVAFRHIDTGLNVAFSFADVAHTRNCDDPGEVTGLCRGDDRIFYVNGGIVRDDLAAWGPTSIYGEFYRGMKSFNESDPAVLAALERLPGTAAELKDGRATMWGAGVVQAVESWNTQFYVGYRHYDLGVGLLGASGAVAAKKLDSLDMIMVGAEISF